MKRSQSQIYGELKNRFDDIKKGSGKTKENRLRSLMRDVQEIFDIKENREVRVFYMTVGEELSECLKGVAK